MAEIFYHTFDPVYDNHSRVLILGSFPSVKSREQGFYYGHPQNRFWKVLSAVFSSPVPQSIEEKKNCCSITASRSGMSRRAAR